ncbi:MAG: hypothetical protein D6696_03115 [Acidobacteria bacterium]|nr:MAG: hypothetical protein D6696_03115 [Acidobacteriota bacterium]
MALHIFVEDRETRAYEILARRALEAAGAGDKVDRLRASKIDLRDLITTDGLRDLLSRAVRSGYDCVMFVMDQEARSSSPERPRLLARFKKSFTELCSYQAKLPERDPMRRARIIRVVCRRCLEGWLASDPQAVVDAVRGVRGTDYSPSYRQTEHLEPKKAGEQIVRWIREVGHRLGRRDLQRTTLRNVKSRSADIAEQLDPQRGRSYNASLAYFFDMVHCQRSGCDHPFPERG